MTRDLRRGTSLAAAAALALLAVVAIWIVLAGDLRETDVRTLLSLPAFFLCGGAAVASLAVLARGRLALLGAVTLTAAAAALVAFLLGVWKGEFGDGANDYAVKLTPSALAWVIATIVVATLPLIVGDRRLLRTLLPAVAACSVAGALLATILLWTETTSESWGKTLAVLAILMVAGYLLAAPLERLLREDPADGEATGAVSAGRV